MLSAQASFQHEASFLMFHCGPGEGILTGCTWFPKTVLSCCHEWDKHSLRLYAPIFFCYIPVFLSKAP